MRVRTSLAGSCAAALVTAAVVIPASGAQAADPVIVVSGLNNPRQVVLTDDGALLVAEAGRGATDPSGCVGENCVGATGSIAHVRRAATTTAAAPRRVVTGLLSSATPDGLLAVGPNGVAVTAHGTVYTVLTAISPETVPAGLPAWQAGKLLRADRHGNVRAVADIAAFETANDPDGEGVESNPYAVLALPGRTLVADAAGDSVVEVRRGRVRLFAVLPELGTEHDAVPTSLAAGHDGRIYVGELHWLIPRAARVLVYSRGGRLVKSIDGFTTIHGVAVDRRGNVYVSELYAGPNCSFQHQDRCGQVTRVTPAGDRTTVPVPLPGGIAVDRHGTVFVAAWSTVPATGMPGRPELSGQVWRLRL